MKHFATNLLYLFVAVLISIVLVMAFHDTLVRWIALHLVQQVPGIEAQVEGPFDVTHVVPLTLDAAGVSLAFTGDKLAGTRAQLGAVHLEMRPWPLLRGVVYIERLLIADADLEIPPVGAARSPEQSPSAVHLPLIEELRLERVHVRIGRAADRSPHELTIANLQLGESESGVLTASGTAKLDGHDLGLSAELGSPEELRHPTVPFPIDATLQAPSWNLEWQSQRPLAGPLSAQ